MKDEKPRHGPVRRTFRWCRRTVYLLVLFLAAFVVRLNQAGLPEFLKRPLLSQLRERGLELDFSRMRLRFGRGVVVEHVNVSRQGEAAGEQFHAEELQLRIRWAALLEFRAPEVVALTLRDGRITLPLTGGTHEPPIPFSIDQVQARILFSGPEVWELEELDAVCHGGTFHASGTLTNVSVLRSVRPPKPDSDPSHAAWRRGLFQVARFLEHNQFTEPPELRLRFVADLRKPAQSGAEILLHAPAASNRWGRVRGLEFRMELIPPADTNAPLQAELRLTAARMSTPWADFSNLVWKSRVRQSPTNVMPDLVTWELACNGLETPLAAASTVRVSGRSEGLLLPASLSAPWRMPAPTDWAGTGSVTQGFTSTLRIELGQPSSRLTNSPAASRSAEVELRILHDLAGWREVSAQAGLSGLTSQWGTVEGARVELELRPRTDPPQGTEEWAFWGRLAPLLSTGRVSVTRLETPQLSVPGVAVRWAWNAPVLELNRLELEFGGGIGQANARLDVSNRQVTARAVSAFDIHRINPLLTTNAARWLTQYEWRPEAPPRLEGEVGVRLPAWTNRHPDWRGEVLPTLTIDASLQATNGGFRGVPADQATGRITLTNRIWSVRNMQIRRPEGTLDFDYTGSEETKDYHFRLRSTLDPRLVLPLLESDDQRRFAAQLQLGPPPLLEGDVWGRWRVHERSGLDLHVAATNFVIRGEPIESVDGHVTYTNGYLAMRDVRIRSDGEASVPGAAYDVARQLVSFTNTTSTLPVLRVARVIGPKLTKTLSNYVFSNPPAVWLEGTVQIHGQASNDLRLEVRSQDFSWWRVHGTNVSGHLHLLGETMTISNLQAGVYGGGLGGDLHFDWTTPSDTRFNLSLDGVNIGLVELLRDISPATNRLEGRLTGTVVVTQGSTTNHQLFAGYGRLHLEDGYLWGLPVFGLFSPLFDALSPGLGQTRFTEGAATFVVTNSVLTTRDMEMKSATMRLQYRGSLDVAGHLDATMEAELFRDMPLIGRLLQFAFTPVTKLLEYRIRGTVMKPDPEPRYLPRFLLMVLRPFATLKTLLPAEEKPAVPPPVPTPVPVDPPPP